MKVSIVIAYYKQPEFLLDAVSSACRQTYKNTEIILVDDGSPDNTAEVVAKAWPVKLIRQTNRGLASARNTGIMNMRGQLFLPLDSDDILTENAVEEMVRVYKSSGADIIAPSMQTFGTSQEQVILMASPTLNDFRTGNRIPYCSLFKRSDVQEVGGYSKRMAEGYEDLYLTINLLSKGRKIVTIPQPLFYYRTKEDSMWHDAKKHHTKLMNQIYKDFPSFLPV